MTIFIILTIISGLLMILGFVLLYVSEEKFVYNPKLEGTALAFIGLGSFLLIVFSLLGIATKQI